jgi:hypothetical protein
MHLSEAEWEKAHSAEFQPISEGRLHLKYPDGEERIFDQDFFNTVKNLDGMPDWDNGLINFSPETMLIESEIAFNK